MTIKSTLAIAVSLALCAPAAASELRRVGNAIPGQYIVVFKEDVMRGKADAARAKAGKQAPAEDEYDAELDAVVDDEIVDVAILYDLKVERRYSQALQGMAVSADECR